MKHLIAPLFRTAKHQLERFGIDLRGVSGRDHSRAGIELLWHRFDEKTERVFISHVEYDGVSVAFLVRKQEDYIQNHFLKGRFYSVEELQAIKGAYTAGAFVDIGANVGNHSMFAAKILKAPQVFSFEPNPEAYRILMCNVALNDLTRVVEALPYGLSDRKGAASVRVPDATNLGGARLDMEEGGAIQLYPGDELLENAEVGFIKIDVEGLEMEVLGGLGGTILRCRPPMLVEVDDPNRSAFDAWCDEYRYRAVFERRPYRNMANLLVTPLP